MGVVGDRSILKLFAPAAGMASAVENSRVWNREYLSRFRSSRSPDCGAEEQASILLFPDASQRRQRSKVCGVRPVSIDSFEFSPFRRNSQWSCTLEHHMGVGLA